MLFRLKSDLYCLVSDCEFSIYPHLHESPPQTLASSWEVVLILVLWRVCHHRMDVRTQGKWTLCQLVRSALPCSAGHYGASLEWSKTHHISKNVQLSRLFFPVGVLKQIAVLVQIANHLRPWTRVKKEHASVTLCSSVTAVAAAYEQCWS